MSKVWMEICPKSKSNTFKTKSIMVFQSTHLEVYENAEDEKCCLNWLVYGGHCVGTCLWNAGLTALQYWRKKDCRNARTPTTDVVQIHATEKI